MTVLQRVALRLQVLQADAGVRQGNESFAPFVDGPGREEAWDMSALEDVQVVVRTYLQCAGTGGIQLEGPRCRMSIV